MTATSCEHAPAPVVEPASTLAPSPPRLEPQRGALAPVAWATAAPPIAVPEMHGVPVVMKAGERCRSFRALPSMRYSESTLVRDACLRIPGDARIELENGVTLVIVATNGISIGSKVVFEARGVRGLRGNRSTFARVSFAASSDEEIRSLCVDNGNQCACAGVESTLASIRGHTGGSGSPGGTLHLVSPELVTANPVSGFGADVSGGAGGPAGESGTRECALGALRCYSPPCSSGVASGADGAVGKVFLSLAGAAAAASIERMRPGIVPAGALVVVPLEPGAAFREQLSLLEDQAIREGWQRRSGVDA